MSLQLWFEQIPDPHGHSDVLLLPGDWLIVLLSDGRFVGIGEASHSGDDAACTRRVQLLFEQHVRHTELSLDAVKALEVGPLAHAPDHISATAISALNQALYDLVARRQGIPVWRLFADQPAQTALPVYLTINRALTTRSLVGYASTVERAQNMGFGQLKCAPFERVAPKGNQLEQAQEGLSILNALRCSFPDLSLRLDCHKRFSYGTFVHILSELEGLALHWVEEPCPFGGWYADIRRRMSTPLAAGELYFGVERFRELASRGWVDVIMPDVKHVGGLGPLLAVCHAVETLGVEVSPHNPSGPVSTLASGQAAAFSHAVTSVELSVRTAEVMSKLSGLLSGGYMTVLDTPGWGIEYEELMRIA